MMIVLLLFLQKQNCGGVANGEGQRRGGARWWDRQVTTQPEHIPSRWCPNFAGRSVSTVRKLLAVLLVPKGLKIVFCLFVGYVENQTQELAVDESRGGHARLQKSHMPGAAIFVAIIVYQQIGLPATRILRVSRSSHWLPSLVSTRL